ncbi:MAG: lipid A biosynthesis acyltransferase [Janthinobacterium lividum]
MRLLLALMWLLHWLPLPVLGRLGHGAGALLYLYMHKRRHVTLTNLRLCFPEYTEKARRQLARQHFQAYARSLLERGVLWWAPRKRLQRLIQVEPGVPVAAFAARPTIMLCPHFVSLDVAGVAIMLECIGSSIYTEQRNKVFDRALRRGRTRFRPSMLFSRAQGVKPIIRALRDHIPFFMLPDMDFGSKESVFVPFFGVPASTLTATARIASATSAQVVPVIATFLPDYRGWKIRFYPAWDDFPGDDITAATRRVNAFIEERVLEAPAQYLWTHKRFKTRPPGEPGVY